MQFKYILFILFIPFYACTQQKVESNSYSVMLQSLLSHSVNEVQVNEININSNNFVFLDAREKEEYDISHLKNAVWVGYDDFNIERANEINKTDSIIVYCSVGYRSEKVAEKLIASGFKNVSNLYGGIFEWKNQDKTVVNNNGSPTDSVHVYNQSWGIWLNNGIKTH